MDILSDMISGLNPVEQKQLEKYLNYKSSFKDRKDKQLLSLLQNYSELSQEELIRKLYNIPEKAGIEANTRNSYYQWRSILTTQVEGFTVEQITQEDTSYYIIKLTLVARFLLIRKKYRAAYKYLQKAEELALKVEQYDLLQRIYSLQIEYAWVKPEIEVDLLIAKWKENTIMMQKDSALNIALSLIRKRLADAHKVGESINVDNLAADILTQYNINEEISKNVNTRYKLAMIVLVSLEEKRNYAQLTEYLIQTLKEMESKAMFDKYNYRIKIELLTFICRYSIKSKNYDLCEHYLSIVKKEHSLYPEHTFLNIQSVMIEYVFLVSSGRLEEAGKIIYEAQKSHINRIIEEDDYYFVKLHSNLISFNFFSGNLPEAKKYMRELLLSEKRQKNHDGLSAVVCSHLIDCMINIDGKDYDYALFKIKAMQKRFVTFLDQPNHLRFAMFLKLLKHIAQAPKYINTKAFKDEAADFLSIKDIEVGSVEFIPFNPYIISKLENEPYYQVFCKLLKKS